MAIIPQIPCPNCGTGTIRLVPEELLTGAAFKCPVCQTAVSLSPQSHATLRISLENLEKLKSSRKGSDLSPMDDGG